MIYSIIAGDSSQIWDIGFNSEEDPLADPVLADMADGFSCRIVVPGTTIDREVAAISTDGHYFRAALLATETIDLLGVYTVAIELRNPGMQPPLVRETHIRIRVSPGLVPLA